MSSSEVEQLREAAVALIAARERFDAEPGETEAHYDAEDAFDAAQVAWRTLWGAWSDADDSDEDSAQRLLAEVIGPMSDRLSALEVVAEAAQQFDVGCFQPIEGRDIDGAPFTRECGSCPACVFGPLLDRLPAAVGAEKDPYRGCPVYDQHGACNCSTGIGGACGQFGEPRMPAAVGAESPTAEALRRGSVWDRDGAGPVERAFAEAAAVPAGKGAPAETRHWYWWDGPCHSGLPLPRTYGEHQASGDSVSCTRCGAQKPASAHRHPPPPAP